jgi:hypothetical protein
MKRILVLACLLLLLPVPVAGDSYFAVNEEPLPDCTSPRMTKTLDSGEVVNLSVTGTEVVSFFLCFTMDGNQNESMIFDFDISLSEDENYTLSIPIVSKEVEAWQMVNFSFSLTPPNENRTDELKVSVSTEHDSNMTEEINFLLHVSETNTTSESVDESVPALGILATSGVVAVAALFWAGAKRRNDDTEN